MSACTTAGDAALIDFRLRASEKLKHGQTELLGEFPLERRTLSYKAVGAGEPVLFFPGNLNSRLFQPAWELSEQIALNRRVRVITIDRPGVGLSSLPPVC